MLAFTTSLHVIARICTFDNVNETFIPYIAKQLSFPDAIPIILKYLYVISFPIYIKSTLDENKFVCIFSVRKKIIEGCYKMYMYSREYES